MSDFVEVSRAKHNRLVSARQHLLVTVRQPDLSWIAVGGGRRGGGGGGGSDRRRRHADHAAADRGHSDDHGYGHGAGHDDGRHARGIVTEGRDERLGDPGAGE